MPYKITARSRRPRKIKKTLSVETEEDVVKTLKSLVKEGLTIIYVKELE